MITLSKSDSPSKELSQEEEAAWDLLEKLNELRFGASCRAAAAGAANHVAPAKERDSYRPSSHSYPWGRGQ